MSSNTTREGFRSPTNGHLGVYTLCSGPDPNGPVPGERLRIVIYDEHDNIVRRLEQVEGDTLDPGYVDFFLSAKCRPSLHSYHIIDIEDQQMNILATHTSPEEAKDWLVENVPKWVQEHGIPQ
jgi:mannosyltransferase OCH1-like enzyme